MDTLIIYTEPEKTIALIEFLKAFDIKFEVKQKKVEKTIPKDKAYNQEFVKKIKQSKIDKKNGKGTKVNIKDLESLWN